MWQKTPGDRDGWRQLFSDDESLSRLGRRLALVIVFLLGVAACGTAIVTGNLGLFAAGTTLFGLIGVAKS